MSAAPLLISTGTTGPVVPAPTATAVVAVPVDVHTQIQNVYGARQAILEELSTLEELRTELGRSTALAVASDIAINAVDPAKSVVTRDAWHTKDASLTTQHDALNDLLTLIEARISDFKLSNPVEVSAVIRAEIATLSDGLSQQQKAEELSEAQLMSLWDELREVDPDSVAALAKESRPRARAGEMKAHAEEKAATEAPKNGAKK